MRHLVQWIPRRWRLYLGHGALKPLAYVFLPGVVATYYQTTCMQTSLQRNWPWLHDFASAHGTAFVVSSFAIMAAVFAAESVRTKARTAETQGEDVLTAFVTAIDNVVGLKANRFGKLAVELPKSSSKMSPGSIFKTITEPRIQIDALLTATLDVFRQLWPNVTFKASLIRVIDGKHFQDPFYKFLPEDRNPRTTPKQLEEDPGSAASKALKKKLVIVSDFRAELKKNVKDRNYSTTEDRFEEDGSMLAFRIDHPWLRLPVYILSVCADKKQCITAEHRVTYHWLMKEIEKRIILEHSLALLKKDDGG